MAINLPVEGRLTCIICGCRQSLRVRTNQDITLGVNNRTTSNASPYIMWTRWSHNIGTVVVSDADDMGLFIKRNGGVVDSGELHATPAGSVYSRSIRDPAVTEGSSAHIRW